MYLLIDTFEIHIMIIQDPSRNNVENQPLHQVILRGCFPKFGDVTYIFKSSKNLIKFFSWILFVAKLNFHPDPADPAFNFTDFSD